MRARLGAAVALIALLALAPAGPAGAAFRSTIVRSSDRPAPSLAVPGQDEPPQLPEPETSPERARREARRIVAQDEYHRRTRGTTILDRIRRWLGDRLPDFNGGDGLRMPRFVSFAVVAAVVAVAIAVIVLGLARSRRAGKAPDDSDDDTSSEVDITPLRSAHEWEAEAERLEGAGEWRGALRARYRALVGALVDRGHLVDLPGRTPGEHRADLDRTVPPAAPAFAQVTERFEEVWFGHDEAAEGDLEHVRDLAVAVLERAPRKEAPRPPTGETA